MLTYSALYAQNNFAELLKKAKEAHEVLIEAEDGLCFLVRLLPERKSKYNLPDVNLDLSREEIVRFVREGRNRE
ncbi:hypothetical protein [Candidatus Electronema sp. TJ]|uniref:hypothetical protein n=1 Tax=Candidatus Electronema sp. TJ TaxID=3401573 RepID=UPI003AA891F7